MRGRRHSHERACVFGCDAFSLHFPMDTCCEELEGRAKLRVQLEVKAGKADAINIDPP